VKRTLSSDQIPSVGDGNTLIGIACSHGVVVAPAIVLGTSRMGFPRRRVPAEEVPKEWARFVDAVCDVQADLRAMIDKLEDEGRVEASILEAYLLMVGDETLARQVHGHVHERRRCADWAVASASDHLAGRLASVDDPYIQERSHDIRFVGERLLRALVGDAGTTMLSIDEPSIIVAHDLSPADTAAFAGAPVVGFVTEMGSRTSHTAIMARALEIPAVLGVTEVLQRIATGDSVVVDGLRGRVVVSPTEEQLEDAERRAARYTAMAVELNAHKDLPAVTTDAVKVSLNANIELPEEAAIALAHGAEGVGLYRTEFLYVNRSAPPSEDTQLEIFRRVLKDLGPLPTTLRTFDIGGDKFVTTFQVPGEMNPMLGLRAVRLALAEQDVFMTHLRAMVRATAFGQVRIMIPLVSTLDELRVVRQLLRRAHDDVRAAGQACADNIELGVMIEVPAAAIMADVFAAHADFMSIGTNDLVQYALAIDRTNRALAYLASPFDPSVLRLIDTVIRAGKKEDCPVSVCGEMASEPYGALMLIGLGVRNLSMESVAIPEVKEAIRRASCEELEQLARTALEMSTAVEVETLLTDAFEPRLHDILTGQPQSIPFGTGAVSSRGSSAGPSRGALTPGVPPPGSSPGVLSHTPSSPPSTTKSD
jgi:phosphotransferase system enzyme I (PtsI)